LIFPDHSFQTVILNLSHPKKCRLGESRSILNSPDYQIKSTYEPDEKRCRLLRRGPVRAAGKIFLPPAAGDGIVTTLPIKRL
jgi:hypothetical protein